MTKISKNETKRKNYKDWYSNWNKYLGWLNYLLLACSCIASFKFYEYLLGDYEYRTEAAYLITTLSSIFLGKLTIHCLDFYHQNKDNDKTLNYDVFIIPLAALILWGAYADFNGSPEIAESFTDTPINTESKAIQDRLDAIDAKKRKLLDTYTWKGNTIDKLPRNNSKWHDTESDRKQMKQYDSEKSVLIASMSTHTEQHGINIDKHNSKLEKTKKLLKGFSIGFAIIYLLIQWWRFEYKYTTAPLEEKPKNKKARKPKKRKAVKQKLIGRTKLTNSELNEELAAMHEKQRQDNLRKDNDLF